MSRSASDAFGQVVSRSHRAVIRCDVLFNRETILEGLNLVDGTITYDRTAARLARFTGTLAEPTRLPTGPASPLSPFGYELQIWRGVELGRSNADPFAVQAAVDSPGYAITFDGALTDYGTEQDLTVTWGTPSYQDIAIPNYLDARGLNTRLDFGGAMDGYGNLIQKVAMIVDVPEGNTGKIGLWSNGGNVTGQGGYLDGYDVVCVNINSTVVTDVASYTLPGPGVYALGFYVGRFAGENIQVWVNGTVADSAVMTAGANNGTADPAFGACHVRAADTGLADISTIDGTGASIAQAVYVHGGGTCDFTAYYRAAFDPTVLDLGEELLPLGTFPIQQSQTDAVEQGSQIVAEDRSRLVSDARFEDTYVVAAGTNYATAIEALIDDGVSGLEYLFPTVTFTTPQLVFAAQSDRWEAAQQMAKSIGHEIFFDGLGRVVMRPEPTFAAEAVATYQDAENLVSAVMQLDRTNAYNKVIATSKNASTGTVYRGEAVDDDPTSPTFYGDTFGRKPRFFYSEFLASNEQCETAAAAILASQLGVARSITWTSWVDPRRETSDVIRLINSKLGIDELHILDRVEIGLSASGTMSVASRSQQTGS